MTREKYLKELNDYIIWLEQEASNSNKFFIERNEAIIEKDKYKKVIDKAIKYINSKTEYYYENGKELVCQATINSIDLLNILQGSDNNDK